MRQREPAADASGDGSGRARSPTPRGADAMPYAELYHQLLARHQRELGELQYVISHDLQEPLRKITGFVGLLTRRYAGQLDRDADEYFEFITEACDRLQQLIQDLLSLSRIETRGSDFAPVATAELVDQVVTGLGQAADGVEVSVGREMPTIAADPQQLRTLFQHLLENAVKFHGDAPLHIRVAAERRPRDWHFRIADNGIGIEECYAGKIFGVFQRLHTREEYPGTGIGLALAKKIIERHGGEIWVESAPGKGTTFHFTIPDRKEETDHVSA